MASTVPINVAAVFIGTTETTIGTVPGGKEWNIAVIRFCNTDSVDHTLTIYNYDPGSETATDLTSEYKTFTVQAGSTFEYGPAILASARKISAKADLASKINARIHGWETTP